jgi:hypothetical protein
VQKKKEFGSASFPNAPFNPVLLVDVRHVAIKGFNGLDLSDLKNSGFFFK